MPTRRAPPLSRPPLPVPVPTGRALPPLASLVPLLLAPLAGMVLRVASGLLLLLLATPSGPTRLPRRLSGRRLSPRAVQTWLQQSGNGCSSSEAFSQACIKLSWTLVDLVALMRERYSLDSCRRRARGRGKALCQQWGGLERYPAMVS